MQTPDSKKRQILPTANRDWLRQTEIREGPMMSIMIWTILGVSVAIVALFCIGVAETFVGKEGFELNRGYVALAFGVAGGAAWLIGRFVAGKDGDSASRRYLLADLRYWGPMLLVLGVITLFIRPLRSEPESKPAVAAAKPAPRKPAVVAQVAPAPAPAPKPAVFPAVKLQGIIYREQQAFAILNGESYASGDHVGGAVVKSITRDAVQLEAGGETKVLALK